ncbi:hypothetical protein [Clostridium hydrogeniformans]|uniref:hypothetical protein n=1 Tax=Clostridium hydrogeniformans TaxID=349933 RepID=UPI000A861A19|nr:hypothetical protein [Clostridium hydrogeniformans]
MEYLVKPKNDNLMEESTVETTENLGSIKSQCLCRESCPKHCWGQRCNPRTDPC